MLNLLRNKNSQTMSTECNLKNRIQLHTQRSLRLYLYNTKNNTPPQKRQLDADRLCSAYGLLSQKATYVLQCDRHRKR